MCDLIANEANERERWLVSDPLWTAFVRDVPGWIFVATRRHVDGAGDMTDEEAEGFGVLVRRLTQLLESTAGAERVYLGAAGEHARHWHAVLASRTADLPAEHRGLGLLLRTREMHDTEGSLQVAAELRKALGAGHDDNVNSSTSSRSSVLLDPSLTKSTKPVR
jgi:diadenosine tetraphosphate (Ap4A) HIT family hydrolase